MPVEIATSPPKALLDPASWMPSVLHSSRPDLDVRLLMMRLKLYPVRPGPSYSVDRARRDWQLATMAFGSRERGPRITEQRIPRSAGELVLRVYTPQGDQDQMRPVFVWMHGGGFVIGDLSTGDAICRAISNRSGAIVAAVDYRLAPEHELAVAHQDCLAAVHWLREHAENIGGDPARIAVGGDSAGGTLAASVAQRCAEAGLPLSLQVLVYPAVDVAEEHDSTTDASIGFMLSGGAIQWFRSHMSAVSDLSDPALSPLRAADLAGLAPALIITAGFDPLRDEGLAYAARLREHGVATRSLHYPSQIHGFVSFDRVVREARDALDRTGRALQQVFREGGLVPESEEPWTASTGRRPSALSPREFGQRWREARVAQLLAAEWIRCLA